MKLKRISYLFSQPHQIFFALGLFNSILFMAIFALSFLGKVHFMIDSRLIHSYSMIFLVFSSFFLGFTYTTFPRFSSGFPIPLKSYSLSWLFMVLATVSFIASLWIKEAFFAVTVFVALAFANTIKIFLPIFKQAPQPKDDQYWIIVAFGMGALSNILFLLYQIPCAKCNIEIFKSYGVDIGFYLYTIFLAVVIGFRMVPFFSHCYHYQKSNYFHKLLFGLLLGFVLLENYYPKYSFLMSFFASLLVLRELFRVSLPFPNKEPLLWGLHIGLFWLFFGLFIGSIVQFGSAWFGYSSLRLPLHLLALGFLTSIFVAFGTRVTLGHSQNTLKLDKFGVGLFYFTQIVVLFRVALSLFNLSKVFESLFIISVLAWVLLFLLWSFKYGKALLFGAKLSK